MSKEYSVNYKIKANIVDVVTPEGEMKKNVSFDDAIDMTEEYELDLVEVSPARGDKNAVCKILDYGKLKYKESKRKKTHKQIIKEIKFNFNIDNHDLEIKNKKVKKLLDKKCQIRYSVELRGRERSLIDAAKEKMENSLEQFREVANWTPIKVFSGGKMVRITTVISTI